jgi:hypothetical protein
MKRLRRLEKKRKGRERRRGKYNGRKAQRLKKKESQNWRKF